MKLYPKKLRNIEGLEQERKLLLKQCRKLEEEDFLSLDTLFGKKGSGKEDKDGSILDFLPISNPLVSLAIKMIQSRLSKEDTSSKQDEPREHATKKKGRSPLRAIAFEFIGGYLKWKAIELSFKGIRHILKKRRAGG